MMRKDISDRLCLGEGVPLIVGISEGKTTFIRLESRRGDFDLSRTFEEPAFAHDGAVLGLSKAMPDAIRTIRDECKPDYVIIVRLHPAVETIDDAPVFSVHRHHWIVAAQAVLEASMYATGLEFDRLNTLSLRVPAHIGPDSGLERMLVGFAVEDAMKRRKAA